MQREELLALITPLTPFEEQNRSIYETTGVLYGNRLRGQYTQDERGDYILSNEGMAALDNQVNDEIHITFFPPSLQRKLRFILHSRYAEIPPHYTEFISINYVLHGHLVIHLPERRIILQQGQLILMNSGIVHSLAFENAQDVILGIQIEKDFLGDELLYGLRGSGPVADFLISGMTGGENDFSYMITGFESDERVKDLFLDMFCEAMDAQLDSAMMIQNYMRLLLLSMIRATSSIVKTNSRADIASILNYMETHYADCSLALLAAQYHFNEKYLGNLIRRKTGQTFSQLLESIRMHHAAFYLETTSLPVQTIAETCGYSNMTFFFQRFRKAYGCTPANYRTQMAGQPQVITENRTKQVQFVKALRTT